MISGTPSTERPKERTVTWPGGSSSECSIYLSCEFTLAKSFPRKQIEAILAVVGDHLGRGRGCSAPDDLILLVLEPAAEVVFRCLCSCKLPPL